MSNLVVHNLIVISITLLAIGVLKLVLNWGLNVFFKFGEKLASKLLDKLLFKGSLLISEVIMLSIIVLLIISINKKPIFQVLLFSSAFLVAVLIGGIRQQKPESFSIFKLLPVFPNTETYIANRASLLLNQFPSVMSLLICSIGVYLHIFYCIGMACTILLCIIYCSTCLFKFLGLFLYGALQATV